MANDLYMHKISLDTRGLYGLAMRRNLVGRDAMDLGYITHCVLGELFGDDAPKPFALSNAPEHPNDRTPHTLRVLGYAGKSWDELAKRAKMFADPDIFELCRFRECAGKPMPSEWKPGMRLGFEVRMCPVVRGAKIDGRKSTAELDVYVSACRRAEGNHLDRAVVYRGWLEKQLQVHGLTKLIEARMSRFSLRMLVRRTRATTRQTRTSRRPDATFTGVLEVTDGPKFAGLLARGVGRHRAFGFGMVLLRPAGEGR